MRTALVLGLLVAASPVWAIDIADDFTDSAQQDRYEALIDEVRCLVCQNQTIANSSAPLAADLRREIRRRVERGLSNREIKEFLIKRYGDFVLYRPRTNSWTISLWLAPGLFLLISGVAFARILRRRAKLRLLGLERVPVSRRQRDPGRPHSRR